MDKKILIKIGIMIISFFFALAFMEIIIRTLVGVGNNISQENEEKKQEEIVSHSEKENTKRQITSFLDDILEAIEDKDYNYVFDSLDDIYKDYMFNNEVNKLKTYVEENIMIGKKYEYSRINQTNGWYQVLVGIMDDNKYFSQAYTVKVLNNNKCTFMFGEYTDLNEISQIASYSNIKYKLSYFYATPDVIGYTIDMENVTNDNITISFYENSKIITTNGTTYEGTKPDLILIKPHETSRVEISFLKHSEANSLISLNVAENGVPNEIMISLEKDIM